MKKLVVALLAAFLMAAGLTTAAGAPAVAATAGCHTYGTCPPAPIPPIKKPHAHPGHHAWMWFPNPRHLGGKVRFTITGPGGHRWVITRWTFKKGISLKLPTMHNGRYRVSVLFTPNGNYRSTSQSFGFNSGKVAKPPRPAVKTPTRPAGKPGWVTVANPHHLGGLMRVTIIDPSGKSRVVTKWTGHRAVHVWVPPMKAGNYQVKVAFYPNGNVSPIFPKYSFHVHG